MLVSASTCRWRPSGPSERSSAYIAIGSSAVVIANEANTGMSARQQARPISATIRIEWRRRRSIQTPIKGPTTSHGRPLAATNSPSYTGVALSSVMATNGNARPVKREPNPEMV